MNIGNMAKGMNDVQAWIHDVVQDDGEADHALSFSADSFPLQGVGGFRSVRARPLYTAAPSEILLAYENMIADHAQLQQQLAAAREAYAELNASYENKVWEVIQQMQRADAMETNDSRYRWLRDPARKPQPYHMWVAMGDIQSGLAQFNGAPLDAHIDAEIAAEATTLQRDRQP